MESARPTLLNAAREFMRRSAGTAALVIAPLAAASLANSAHAQTVFVLPGSLAGVSWTQTDTSVSINSSGSPNSYFQSTGTGFFGASASVMRVSGGSGVVGMRLSFGSSASGTLGNGVSVPVSYSFTTGATSGAASGVTWTLSLQVNGDSGTLRTIASGAGLSSFSGTVTYTNDTGSGLSLSSYELRLDTSHVAAENVPFSVTMISGSQGLAINAIPEPSTYALLFGLGAGVLAIFRRRGRRAAAG